MGKQVPSDGKKDESDQTSPEEEAGWKEHQSDQMDPESNPMRKVSGWIRSELEKEKIFVNMF